MLQPVGGSVCGGGNGEGKGIKGSGPEVLRDVNYNNMERKSNPTKRTKWGFGGWQNGK